MTLYISVNQIKINRVDKKFLKKMTHFTLKNSICIKDSKDYQ